MQDYFQVQTIVCVKDASTLVKYICLYNPDVNKYAVLSANYFYKDMRDEDILFFERQLTELLLELPPTERCDWFESVGEAILKHNLDFCEI